MAWIGHSHHSVLEVFPPLGGRITFTQVGRYLRKHVQLPRTSRQQIAGRERRARVALCVCTVLRVQAFHLRSTGKTAPYHSSTGSQNSFLTLTCTIPRCVMPSVPSQRTRRHH